MILQTKLKDLLMILEEQKVLTWNSILIEVNYSKSFWEILES